VGNYARGFRPSDDVLRRYFLGWSVRARAAYIRGLVRAKSWRGIDKLLGEVRAPAIVLHGEEDGLVPVRFAHELAARLGCADVRILPKTGHAPHIEQVDATVSAIEAALHRRA
jgi:pimeloyl-ACP methyl ester carboxylesterase